MACSCCCGAQGFGEGWRAPVGEGCLLLMGWGTVCTKPHTLCAEGGVSDHPQVSKGLMLGGSARDLAALLLPQLPLALLLFSFLAPLKPVGQFLRQGCEVADSLSRFLPWSLSLQCTVVGFRFAFTIPLHLRECKAPFFLEKSLS